eukprot:3206049-Pyramimonas_sp.AAC.1
MPSSLATPISARNAALNFIAKSENSSCRQQSSVSSNADATSLRRGQSMSADFSQNARAAKGNDEHIFVNRMCHWACAFK